MIDLGVCHYMVTFRAADGALTQFDFGPRGGDVRKVHRLGPRRRCACHFRGFGALGARPAAPAPKPRSHPPQAARGPLRALLGGEAALGGGGVAGEVRRPAASSPRLNPRRPP
jgi:hypothetical protein